MRTSQAARVFVKKNGKVAVLEINGTWFLYFDKYVWRQFGLLVSTDLQAWTDVSRELDLPVGIRHGTAFKAPIDIIADLPR